jgi:hypothetical protein
MYVRQMFGTCHAVFLLVIAWLTISGGGGGGGGGGVWVNNWLMKGDHGPINTCICACGCKTLVRVHSTMHLMDPGQSLVMYIVYMYK